MFVVLLLLSCSPKEEPVIPIAPSENDPAYAVDGLRAWALIGNALTEGHETLNLTVTGPATVNSVDVLVGESLFGLTGASGEFSTSLDISALGPGTHSLIFRADNAEVGFAAHSVNRSHPLYVIMSNDWDDPDHSNSALSLQEDLHTDYPELKMTHFVGPYTFTDPEVDPARVEVLVDWVVGMRDTYGDEIGLHIHPWCSFVEAAGLDCLAKPSFVYADGDSSGYSVMCSAYTEEEFGILLDTADALFVEHNLGKPTSFRAGGWSAELHTLRALADAGYIADTSANNWARLEEWDGIFDGLLYDWNQEQWASIGDTSQPYYPSEDDILVPGSPGIPILEVPDNGSLVDYVDGSEMIDIFDANFPDQAPLDSPRAYSIGFHPTNFTVTYKIRLSVALDHVENYLISSDSGPVIYETLSNMSLVWPYDG